MSSEEFPSAGGGNWYTPANPHEQVEAALRGFTASHQLVAQEHETHVLHAATLPETVADTELIRKGLHIYGDCMRKEAAFSLEAAARWAETLAAAGNPTDEWELDILPTFEEIFGQLEAEHQTERAQRIKSMHHSATLLGTIHPAHIWEVLGQDLDAQSRDQLSVYRQHYERFREIAQPLIIKLNDDVRREYLLNHYDELFAGIQTSLLPDSERQPLLALRPGDFLANFNAKETFEGATMVLYDHVVGTFGSPDEHIEVTVTPQVERYDSGVRQRLGHAAAWYLFGAGILGT